MIYLPARLKSFAIKEASRMGSGSGQRELSIVMPCLNEAETVGVCVQKALSFLQRAGVDGEVVVADNGSTDGSVEIAQRAGARVIHVAQKGYGNALMGGIKAAKGRYVIMGDSDDSYDFLHLEPFLEKLKEGYDLVMGNRFRGVIAPGAMPFLHRWLGNPVLSGIGRLLFRSPCRDFHCGLRGFSKSAVERMQLQTTGMEFASEMVVKASLLGMRVTEVPTNLSRAGRSRPPHLRSWRDGWRHLRFLLLFSPRWLFWVPGLSLMALGGIPGIALTFSPIRILGVTFDTNTLLVCSMCFLVGFQVVCLGFFARALAFREGLLPPHQGLEKLVSGASLEAGLLAGLFISVAGLVMLALAFYVWEEQHFGDLSYPQSLRIVIPGVTLVMLGVQIMFSSFFLGLLRMKLR